MVLLCSCSAACRLNRCLGELVQLQHLWSSALSQTVCICAAVHALDAVPGRHTSPAAIWWLLAAAAVAGINIPYACSLVEKHQYKPQSTALMCAVPLHALLGTQCSDFCNLAAGCCNRCPTQLGCSDRSSCHWAVLTAAAAPAAPAAAAAATSFCRSAAAVGPAAWPFPLCWQQQQT